MGICRLGGVFLVGTRAKSRPKEKKKKKKIVPEKCLPPPQHRKGLQTGSIDPRNILDRDGDVSARSVEALATHKIGAKCFVIAIIPCSHLPVLIWYCIVVYISLLVPQYNDPSVTPRRRCSAKECDKAANHHCHLSQSNPHMSQYTEAPPDIER